MIPNFPSLQFEDAPSKLEAVEKKLADLRKREQELVQKELDSRAEFAKRKADYELWVRGLYERIPMTFDAEFKARKPPKIDFEETEVVLGTEEFVSYSVFKPSPK